MKQHILFLIIALATLLPSAFGEEFSPVAVTGYNFDAVVENNATAGSLPNVYTGAATSLDLTGNTFYESGLASSGVGTGLPTSETIAASSGGNNFTFNLASYGNNAGLVSNALQIAPGPGGHAFVYLNLTSPASFSSMAFLGFSTEAQPATAIGDVQLTFTDNSTSVYANALDIPDWYFGSGTVSTPLMVNTTGRVNVTNGLYNQDLSGVGPTDGGKLFASLISLTAGDQAKTVESVGFRITSSTSADRTYIMGVSAVPEPTSLALAAGGVAYMLLYRRFRTERR
jgi:hypothetical protein